MTSKVKNALREVPVSIIRPNVAALRSVDKESASWKEFVDSIRAVGILNPLVGRDMKDRDTGETYIGLVDGLHRYTGACEVGLDTVPMHIIEAGEAEALMAQIITNIQTIETKPAQYAAALKRVLVLDDTLTLTQLSENLGKSPTWLSERLKLTNLTEGQKKLVDEGKIRVTNAQALANLPEDERDDYIERAMTMTPSQFLPLVTARVSELKSAARQGRAPAPKEFQPVPFLQTYATIRDEMDALTIGRAVINENGVTEPIDVWHLALQWVLHFDKASKEKQHSDWVEMKRQKEIEKEKRKRERMEKATKDAADVA